MYVCGCVCAGHRRSTSHHNISREISLTELKLPRPGVATCAGLNGGSNICQTQREVDPEFFKVSQSGSQRRACHVAWLMLLCWEAARSVERQRSCKILVSLWSNYC